MTFNKRWATSRDIHNYFSPDRMLNLPRLAREGRVERRLSQGNMWEYYVPQVREYVNKRRGNGNYVTINSKAPGARATAQLANHS